MAEAVSIAFDPAAALAGLDRIAEASEEAVRPAAQAGAQVFYEEVLRRVPVGKVARVTKSGRTIAPGALKASIYQVFSKDNSEDDRATYHVSWNAKKAPHGHLVEYGTSRAPAHPFIRPAFAVVQEALAAARAQYGARIQSAIGGVA